MSEIIINVKLKDVIDDITQDLTSIFLTIDSMSLHGHDEKFMVSLCRFHISDACSTKDVDIKGRCIDTS